MKTDNVIQEKSYAFALRIVKLYRYLTEEKKEYVLSKQVLRCGTSIGANIEEGIGGQSKKDFYAKLNIAYKEARETNYWLRILRDSNYLSAKESKAIIEDCSEILRIITAILNTMKTKLNY
ncbi:MAG TPA: four helix bundle protein [Bacteroidia bacterium]|jgi:four helix bundle protein|nr:four helix bundle protein [Bacteroidia bacterium]